MFHYIVSIVIIPFLFLSASLSAKMFHNELDPKQTSANVYEWEQQCSSPFNEMIISWNAKRPAKGHYAIYVSIKTESWSPWLLYAHWGQDFQKTFDSGKSFFIRSYQDTIEIGKGKKGNAFRVQVRAENGASLQDFTRLHACISDLNASKPEFSLTYAENIPPLAVPQLSQMALKDPRGPRLCSPTSTAALVAFHTKSALNPITFAEKVYDEGWDIFGNWVFNVAEAYVNLGDKKYLCYVERVDSFEEVLHYLAKDCPVVISIRGPIKGSAQPYTSGHLLVVTGYDNNTHSVFCMDPAFDDDAKTNVKYAVEDLLTAWKRRGNIAYIISLE